MGLCPRPRTMSPSHGVIVSTLVLLLAVVASCNRAPTMKPPDGGAGPAVSDACAAWATRFCALASTCVPVTLASVGGTDENCRALASEECVEEMAAQGMPAHDGKTAARCYDATKLVTCQDLVQEVAPSGCTDGTLSDGTPCLTARQCKGGVCINPTGCGTCATAAHVGDACTDSTQCIGLPACLGGHCIAYGDAGDPCLPLSCKLGLGCIDGTCKEQLHSGAPCNTVDSCSLSEGLSCMNGTCTAIELIGDAAPCGNIGTPNVCRYPDHCQIPGFVSPDMAIGHCEAGATVGEPCPDQACRDRAICRNGRCVPLDGVTCSELPP